MAEIVALVLIKLRLVGRGKSMERRKKLEERA